MVETCDKGSQEDRISQLPDPLICQILSHLPTNDAVRTSVFSPRWKSLWLWIPRLELNTRFLLHLNDFVSFGDRFFDSNRVSCIDYLKLTIFDYCVNKVLDYDTSHFTSWVDAAVKRKVQHLHIQCPPKSKYCNMHVSLFVCETLVSLNLFDVTLDDAEFVSFPLLKTMRLNFVWFPNDATFERLVSSCPVLEGLQIVGCVNASPVYFVNSRSLKTLNIIRNSSFELAFGSVAGVVIDAPLLCCLRIIDSISKSFIVNNILKFSAALDISLIFGLKDYEEASVFYSRSRIRSFLAGISEVKDMTICSDTFKIIHQYSIFEPLPQFVYMSCLCVTLHAPSLNWLAAFLESCPNLKSLVVLQVGWDRKMYFDEMNHIGYPSVSKCLLSSLEFVDFKFRIVGNAAEMKLVRYFLEYSTTLKTLTVRLENPPIGEKSTIKELLTMPRGSTECEVVVL